MEKLTAPVWEWEPRRQKAPRRARRQTGDRSVSGVGRFRASESIRQIPVNGISDDQTSAIEEQFVESDEGGLEAAYHAYGATIFSYCRRRLGPDAAADATQEVFVAAWRSRQRFDPSKGSLPGWLTGIARFKVLDALRASGRLPCPVDENTVEGDRENSSDDPLVDEIAERMLVAEALGSLPCRAEEAIRLAFFSHLTHAEIAQRTGSPLGTVKSDIRRGLTRMKRHLDGLDEVTGGDFFHPALS